MEQSINSSSFLTPCFQTPSLNDDDESGIEASASSMASDEDEHHKELFTPLEVLQERQAPTKSSTLNFLKTHNSKSKSHRRRMSSGNSSTESNTTNTRAKLRQTNDCHAFVKIAHSSTAMCKKVNDLPTPSSGYDGDTESPVNEDL